jgi:excisionase family DNA binding protein
MTENLPTAAQQRDADTYKLMNIKEAAERLGIKPHTLSTWITTKRYPIKSIKLGRLVKFREKDLIEFIESRVRTTAVDPSESREFSKKGHS